VLGWTYELEKGLNKLLEAIMNDEIGRLVLTHKDRLLRFGAELVFALCEAKSVEIVILNKGENLSFEEELAQDVLEIITVFSARLYGSRSKKNQKLIQAVKDAL
jgi:predicted site-specific integrase-resolvase